MRMYPERPAAVVRQVVADLLVVGWVCAWAWIGLFVHRLVGALAGPGEQLERMGDGLAANLDATGGSLDRVPLIGDEAASSLRRAADSARSIAGAGVRIQQLVHEAAVAVPVALLIGPMSLVLLAWLPRRIGRARRLRAAVVLRGDVAGRDLLALRALATLPLPALAAAGPGIGDAWRRGDPAAVATLAALALRREGLRPLPARRTPSAGLPVAASS